MKLTKAFDILAIAVIAAALAFTGLQLFRAAPNASAAETGGPIYAMSTSSSTPVLTTSKSIAATSTGRRYLEIYNFSATPISCAYNDAPATLTTGFFIAGSSSRAFFGETLYTGAIRCIAGATANITVNEAL